MAKAKAAPKKSSKAEGKGSGAAKAAKAPAKKDAKAAKPAKASAKVEAKPAKMPKAEVKPPKAEAKPLKTEAKPLKAEAKPTKSAKAEALAPEKAAKSDKKAVAAASNEIKFDGEMTEDQKKWLDMYKKHKAEPAQVYNMREQFLAAKPLEHKILGWGWIVSNENDRLEVLFKDGKRMLISNYKN